MSAFACFHLVVAPTLRKLRGDPHPRPRRLVAHLGASVRGDPERPEYHRAVLSAAPSGLLAFSTGGQISSRLLSCRGADALIELPAAVGSLPAGTRVSVLLIGGLHRGMGSGTDDPALGTALAPEAPPSEGAAQATAQAGPAVAPSTPPAAPPPHPPPPPMPAALTGLFSTRAPPLAGNAAAAAWALPAPPPCTRVGLLVPSGAAAGAKAGEEASWAPWLLDVLQGRLAAGSWIADTCEFPPSAVAAADLQPAIVALSGSDRACSLLLCVGGPALCDAAAAAAPRELPGLGSLMRGAALQHAPAMALLGQWGVRACGSSLVVCLPPHAAAAAACLDAVLPALPHAIASAGDRPPLRLRG